MSNSFLPVLHFSIFLFSSKYPTPSYRYGSNSISLCEILPNFRRQLTNGQAEKQRPTNAKNKNAGLSKHTVAGRGKNRPSGRQTVKEWQTDKETDRHIDCPFDMKKVQVHFND
jgi:hypothetical protein